MVKALLLLSVVAKGQNKARVVTATSLLHIYIIAIILLLSDPVHP